MGSVHHDRAPSSIDDGTPILWSPTPEPGRSAPHLSKHLSPASALHDRSTSITSESQSSHNDWQAYDPSQWSQSNDSILGSREIDLPVNANNPVGASVNPKKTKIRLNQKQDLKLVQLCIAHGSTYGQPKNMGFWWDIVAGAFNTWLQQDFTNHRHHVGKLVADRLKFLAILETGDEDNTGPFIVAIDDWIKIVKAHEGEMGQKKKTAEEEKLENKLVKDKRDDWSKLLSQRNKRKLQDSDSENDDEASDEDEANENEQPSSSHSQAFTTPVPRRVQQLRSQSNSRSSSSRATPESGAKMTAAKRAKLETASNSKASVKW